jgi:hypothetical protein
MLFKGLKILFMLKFEGCLLTLSALRLKGNKSAKEMETIFNFVQVHLPETHETWQMYLSQHQDSLKHQVSKPIDKALHSKWKSQDPAARLAYKRQKNPKAQKDNIERIQTQEELVDYCRRFRYRDAIFDVPLRKIIEIFGTFSQDRQVTCKLPFHSCTYHLLVVTGSATI